MFLIFILEMNHCIKILWIFAAYNFDDMILMYHNVSDKTGFNTLSVDNLKEHLEMLANANYKVVDLATYVRSLPHGRDKVLTITFDDAFVGVFHMALPMFRSFNMPFSVFVPTDYVGKYNAWDENLANFQRHELIPWNDLREMAKDPLVTIGSHGCRHISMGQLSEDEFRLEVSESKRILSQQLGKDISFFAFPYGQKKDIPALAPRVLRELSYEAALSTLWKRRNTIPERYALNRLEIRPGEDGYALLRELSRLVDFRSCRQFAKIFIQS